MSSLIMLYANNGRCKKVIYKRSVGIIDNTDAYFTDFTDGYIYGYDTLIYSSANQLTQMISFVYNTKASVVRFYYPTSSDSIPNKLESDTYNPDGTLNESDQLTIAINGMDHPACKLLWYMPFVNTLGGIISQGVKLPILFDGPSTGLDTYLPLVAPKCITSYKVKNNWGYYNYTNSVFNYNYSKDSLQFTSDNQIIPRIYVHYNFKKTKK